MIPVCRDEISTRSAGTDFNIRFHEEIKFHPDKAGQFSFCIHSLLIFLCKHVSLRTHIVSY